jgi:hypothetical protein
MVDKNILAYFWEYYATEHCTLCGNHGVIDSRGTRTSAGLHVGRLNYCICPNGQELREKNGDMEWWLTNWRTLR